MTNVQLGLRERKRTAARAALQRALLELSAERGFDRVTIDDISRAVDMSPRTFFNYFATKEQALTADLPLAVSDRLAEVFVSGGPTGHLLADLAELFAGSLEGYEIDREIHELRQRVFRTDPRLAGATFALKKEMDDRVRRLVAKRLRVLSPKREADAAPLANLASAALLTAWQRWAREKQSAPLAELVRDAFRELVGLVSEYR